MCDEWMPFIKIPMSIEHFRQMPRHPAYKYEYLRSEAWLTPRAKHYHGRLRLESFELKVDYAGEEELQFRHVDDGDFPELEKAFIAAFRTYQPFASLSPEVLAEASAKCLQRTRSAEDGPWVRDASFTAIAGRHDNPKMIAGAAFVTLLPLGDACDFDSYYWLEEPPPDCVERQAGRPHLTWIFVRPSIAREGVGSRLLAEVVRALRSMGFTELYSTFLLGNESSMLWHWRNGFELLPFPGSMRRIREEVQHKMNKEPPL